MKKRLSHFRYSILLVIYLLSSHYSLTAQRNQYKNQFYNYYEAVNAYQVGDTLKAKSIFLDLFGNTEFGNLEHVYNTIIKACAMENGELVKVLAKSGVRKGAALSHIRIFCMDHRFGGRAEYGPLITSDLVAPDSIFYYEGLDSFLISELINLEKRDQLFRDEYPHKASDDYAKFTDSINFLVLQKLIEMEGGQLPSYRKIGRVGAEALNTILSHLDIEMISDIFPAILKSIHQGDFFDAETVLYQIDRNHVGGNSLYRYDKETGHLKAFGDNKFLHDKLGNYQYYGSMDISDRKTGTVNFWPFHPEVDSIVQQEMYDVLYVLPPFTNLLKAHIKERTDQEFIELLLNQG